MNLLLQGILARQLILEYVSREYQFEIITKRHCFLVVFYKGTWSFQNQETRDFIQLDDSGSMCEDGIHTNGLCDEESSQVNPIWLGFCKQRYDHYSKADLGKPIRFGFKQYDPTREIPALVLADLVELIDPEVIKIDVKQTSRNGRIENGEIKCL